MRYICLNGPLLWINITIPAGISLIAATTTSVLTISVQLCSSRVRRTWTRHNRSIKIRLVPGSHKYSNKALTYPSRAHTHTHNLLLVHRLQPSSISIPILYILYIYIYYRLEIFIRKRRSRHITSHIRILSAWPTILFILFYFIILAVTEIPRYDFAYSQIK